MPGLGGLRPVEQQGCVGGAGVRRRTLTYKGVILARASTPREGTDTPHPKATAVSFLSLLL